MRLHTSLGLNIHFLCGCKFITADETHWCDVNHIDVTALCTTSLRSSAVALKPALEIERPKSCDLI
jgi:hypothetical protein